jgi:hypothetical protein
VEKKFWGPTSALEIGCGTYSFHLLATDSYDAPPWNVPATDTIIIPLSGQPPSLSLGTSFSYRGGWPYYDWSLPFMDARWDISMPPEKWENFDKDFEECQKYDDDNYVRSCVKVNVWGFSAYWKK